MVYLLKLCVLCARRTKWTKFRSPCVTFVTRHDWGNTVPQPPNGGVFPSNPYQKKALDETSKMLFLSSF